MRALRLRVDYPRGKWSEVRRTRVTEDLEATVVTAVATNALEGDAKSLEL